jgi:hypothetical protein
MTMKDTPRWIWNQATDVTEEYQSMHMLRYPGIVEVAAGISSPAARRRSRRRDPPVPEHDSISDHHWNFAIVYGLAMQRGAVRRCCRSPALANVAVWNIFH